MHFRASPRVVVLSLLAIPALMACETTPKQRLQGKWVGERVDNFPAAQVGRASGWVTGAAFEFKGSRVTVSIPADPPRHGTYKITKAAQDELLIAFLRPHGAKDEVAFQFENEDRLRWKLGDGRSIVLRKISD